MRNFKKFVVIFLLFVLTLLTCSNVFAGNNASLFQTVEYSEDFKKYLELSDEEKKNVIIPNLYNVQNSTITYKNPLLKARMLKAAINTKYSLKDVIPNNLAIRNQEQTSSCWAFSSLSSLETNLALSNHKKGINLAKVYDFSERHMEYATSKTFANDVENKIGYNRKVGDGGNYYLSSSYLTNGSGAILESQMPFENNENIIDISKIQNKTVSSQVYDTVEFEDYNRYESDEKKAEIMNQIKQHIQNYGSIQASIHGNSSSTSAFECYNNDTGAKYCNSSILHGTDHAVSIIGWDDNYSIDNFSEDTRPKSNGAWIVRNSWGERIDEINITETKQEIFNSYKQLCISKGWNSPAEIPNSIFEEKGYTIKDDIAYIPYGDNGLIYISYEDVNVSKQMFGIVKASDTVDYDYIYQYDEFYPAKQLSLASPNMMLCNIFNKKSNSTEYLTQVSLYAPETYTCKVYVNPNGTSKSKNDLQFVPLKAGDSETFNTGYHTLEFANPVEIKSNSFAVVIEIQSARSSIKIPLESKSDSTTLWDSVTVENGKCFIAIGNNLENCEWLDLGKLNEQKSSLPNGDSTIKAFTTSSLLDGSLKSIEIITPPTKTAYLEGENFDKSGMVVKANYNSKTNPSSTLDNSSYSITNGSNLALNQTYVTISYEGKSVNQPITVEKNDIVDLKIKTPPTKTAYFEGQNFDKSGMVVEVVYKNGSTKAISDYTITNGTNLKTDQTVVTISYEDKTVTQAITVEKTSIVELKIKTPPTKTAYFEGQNFDKSGMVIEVVYKNGSTKITSDYTITNGTNLKADQTVVTISYGDKTVNQSITVEKNNIVGLKIKTPPTKVDYKEGQNFDKSGMVVEVVYKDGSTKTITDYTITDGTNLKVNQTAVTISYLDKTIKQSIKVTTNPLVLTQIKITKAPSKTKYIEGQNFDKSGMVVTVTYNNGTSKEITNYTITDGTNLTKDKKSVTISYTENDITKTATQLITVEEKSVTKISISKNPTKTKYIQNREILDLTGGKLKIYYNDNSTEELDLTSSKLEISGFDNKNLGKNTITITYKSQKTTLDLEIIKDKVIEIVAKNSNFDKCNYDINSIKYYTFSNKNTKEYVLMDITINQISKNTENDKYEYYYYLSSNANEKSIQDWVKINEDQTSNDKLQFKINTKDSKNYEEIANSNTLYLYIKEVATKGGNQAVLTTKALTLNSSASVETYLDNAKVNANINSGSSNKDNTTANGSIPQTGVTTFIISSIILTISIGIICFIKYNKYTDVK